MVSGALELDTSGMKRPAAPNHFSVEDRRERRVA
jgi:hypothetical protein